MKTEGVGDRERRRFLQLMAASVALGAGACSGPPLETIVPYVDTPPELAHGDALFYATAYVRGGYAYGVLVESSMGRATKVEGNADHPSSLGATDVYAQASVLELWDPDRSRAVYAGANVAAWEAYDAAWLAAERDLADTGGRAFRILTGPVTSPTVLAQIARVRKRYPEVRWHNYSPVESGHAAAGARLAFGTPLMTTLDLARARVIVALDADFLCDGPAALRYARDFAAARAPGPDRTRLYVLESTPGLAGANADARLALPPAEIERVVWRVAARLDAAPRDVFAASPPTERWEAAIAKALQQYAGAGVISPGPRMSPATHALVHRLNARLGNAGRTVRYLEPPAAEAEPIGALAADMHAGRVDALLILDANPVYDAPAGTEFGLALERVRLSIHSGLHRNETARACTWHLPAPHGYEQWSDARAYDGTATILQPAMRPLYPSRSVHELLARLAGDTVQDGYSMVRRTWRMAERSEDAPSEMLWREYLRRGVVLGTAHAERVFPVRGQIAPPRLADAPLVAVFTPGSRTDDGRYANNAWLQELPHPITKLVWDNALLIGPATARSFALRNGDVVRAGADGREIECPVWVVPGHAEGVATLPLGYGRRAAGRVGDNVGFDAYRLVRRTVGEPVALALAKTTRHHALVTTQIHMDLHGRDQVRSATLAQFMRNPRFAADEKIERVPADSFYPEYPYPTYAWGMAIDLNACIGCGACTIACQAENNIAVVGKAEVARGREMHWIRVDHYHMGVPDAARSAFMPVPCMHCEKAPCEEVCPVEATLHDSEGLNVQVYNRCIGTRFCNQNCPYKVRRFNFLQYADRTTPELSAMRNPEVTVRQRGVMEKCTYCVQRIARARIHTENEQRRIRDGEVVTACQAVCPTRAIAFGDLNDPQSAVRRVKDSPLNYTLLAELNTRPRTTYLAFVRNPDPALE
jgi:molybdopterin-containing oxidoreductase family iron-sulfur binding subunit